MASLYDVSRDILKEARKGVAWIAVYKVGRGWYAEPFWPDFDQADTVILEEEDAQKLMGIRAIDPSAIFVNGQDISRFLVTRMSHDGLFDALGWLYKNEAYQLSACEIRWPKAAQGSTPGGDDAA